MFEPNDVAAAASLGSPAACEFVALDEPPRVVALDDEGRDLAFGVSDAHRHCSFRQQDPGAGPAAGRQTGQ
jgi:hypothetical protein